MTGKLKNYYKILELELFADEAAVKAAFKKLVRKYHPDVDRNNPSLEEKFKLINEAYEMLGSTEKRAFYDESLKLALGMDGKQPPPGKDKAQPKPQARSGEGARPKPSATSARSDGKADAQQPINEFFESILKKGFGAGEDGKPGEAGKGGSGSFFNSSQKQTASTGKGTPKRGQDATVEAVVTPVEADEGVVKTVNVQHNDVCRRCSGTG